MAGDVVQEQSMALLKAMGLTYHQACIGWTGNGWFVMIYGPRKKPPIVRWMGLPIEYMLDCSMPVPH